jgi:hypothetical protein
MSTNAIDIPSLNKFFDMPEPEILALSKGEVGRFQVHCDGLLALLRRGEKEPPLQPEDVQRIAVRLTWAFYYSLKSSASEEQGRLHAVYLQGLDKLHDVWLTIEKVKLVEEKIVTVREPRAVQQPFPFTMPRDPELVAIVLSPEDV